MQREFINVAIDKEILGILKSWDKQRKENMMNNKNLGTKDPIYKVQSQRERETSREEESDKKRLYIRFDGDVESFETLEYIKEYYNGSDCFESLNDYKNFLELLKNSKDLEDFHKNLSCCKIGNMESDISYIECYWVDIAYFLTREEAEEYKKYQSHNLGVSRTFIEHAGYGNKSSLGKFLQILDDRNIFNFEEDH